MRALLVSTDTEVRNILASAMAEQNLQVNAVSTVSEALSATGSEAYCIVIADERLSDGRGVELAQNLRQSDVGWPFILLLRNDEDETRIHALDAGVDDVLAWPADPALLLAHVRSLMRRCKPGESAVLRFEDLQFDLRSLELKRNQQRIACTSREMAILEHLMRHPRRVVTRNELVDAVWDTNTPPESNVVEVFIARLRNKIDKPFASPLIHTIVGRGYMLSDSRPGAP